MNRPRGGEALPDSATALPPRRPEAEDGPPPGRPRRRWPTVALGTLLGVFGATGAVAGLVAWEHEAAPPAPAPPTGEAVTRHTELPRCGLVEGTTLDGLIPGAERIVAEHGTEAGWEVRDCQWSSTSLRRGETAAFAAVLFVRNDDEPTGGVTGAEIAAEDLAADIADYDGEPVAGIGERAGRWYNPDDGVGCLGAVTANLYTVACYDAQREGEWGRLDPQAAIRGAQEIAAEVVPRVAVGEYGTGE